MRDSNFTAKIITVTTPDAESTALVERATKLVRSLSADLPQYERTACLHELGELFARLRGYYTTTDGITDWRGRSTAYREAVASVYAAAPAGEADRITGSIRYHIGEAVRRIAPEDELQALGLKTAGPVARGRDRRVDLSRRLQAVEKRAPAHVDPERLIDAATGLVTQASAGLDRMTSDKRRASADAKLDTLAGIVRAARRKLK